MRRVKGGVGYHYVNFSASSVKFIYIHIYFKVSYVVQKYEDLKTRVSCKNYVCFSSQYVCMISLPYEQPYLYM
jgi:hypothetical protein